MPAAPAAATTPMNVQVVAKVQALGVSWTEADPDNGYTIQWRTAGQAWPADSDTTRQKKLLPDPKYTITGLVGGTTYQVRVRATKPTIAASAWSSVVSRAALSPTLAFQVPTNFRVLSATDRRITLSWGCLLYTSPSPRD